MLILSNDDIDGLLTNELAFNALERAYRSQAEVLKANKKAGKKQR
jgi:ornithine cyclodeaminase/alanine dehydrogenase-like protein (mu-crystallin family)